MHLAACREVPQGNGKLPRRLPCELLEHRALCWAPHCGPPTGKLSPRYAASIWGLLSDYTSVQPALHIIHVGEPQGYGAPGFSAA